MFCQQGSSRLKALFKGKSNELTFVRANEVAIEVEDSAKVVKETGYDSKSKMANKVKKQSPQPPSDKPATLAKKKRKPTLTIKMLLMQQTKSSIRRVQVQRCYLS